jgi:hypothetical protein
VLPKTGSGGTAVRIELEQRLKRDTDTSRNRKVPLKPFSRIREFHLADWFTWPTSYPFGVAMVLLETSDR